ncbi:MAG: peptidase MA family metallohydrolase [Nitrospirota bacterium]|nr:peptidase MA family metallohydrolase [Nitrospirota bacterium]
MLCTECREKIPDNATHCPACGTEAKKEDASSSFFKGTYSDGVSGKSVIGRYSLLLLVAVLVVVNLLIGYHYLREKLGAVTEPSRPAAQPVLDTTRPEGPPPEITPSPQPATSETTAAAPKQDVDARVHVIEREAHRWDKIESELPTEKVDRKTVPATPAPAPSATLPEKGAKPSEPASAVLSPAALARQYELQGIAEFNKGNYAVALERFELALRKIPANKGLKREIALTFNKIGWANIKKGEYWDAIGNFKEAISYNQGEASFYLGLGLSYFQMKNLDSAIVELGTAAKMSKKDPMPHQLLGQIYYQRDDLVRALEHWEKALELDPQDTHTRSKIAKLKREQAVQSDFNRDTSSHFTIRYEGGEKAEVGKKVLSILEEAYGRLGRELSHFPSEDIVVILYSNQQFRDVTLSPGWAGGVFDGKIRIPIGNIDLNDLRLERVVRHEFTHALVHSIAASIPTWFNEGLARYFEGGNEAATEKKALRGIAAKNMLIPLDALEGGFMVMNKERAWLAYAESLSAVTYLVERYGIYDTKRLLLDLAKGNSMGTAFYNVLFISYEDFQANWKKYLDE